MTRFNLFSVFGAVALAASIIPSVYAGAGSGGGGQAVISQNGTVRFLDLIPNAEVPTDGMSSSGVINRFFKPERYVKNLAKVDTEFFQCASEKLSKHNDVIVLNRLGEILPRLQVLQVEFRIPNIDEASRAELNVPLAAAPSPTIAASLQEALAAYVKGRLWISSRIYQNLNDQEQCGLGIHEAFRHLNFSNALETPLSTPEIETATRWILNSLKPSDEIQPVIAKLNAAKKTAVEWNKIAADDYQKSEELDNERLDQSQLSQAQRDELKLQAQGFEDQAHVATANSMGATLDTLNTEVSISSGIGIFESSALNSAMTDSAGLMSCYDIVALKKVTRIKCNK